MVLPACTFPDFEFQKVWCTWLCSFSALGLYYVCDEAMASEGAEGFRLCNVCIVIVHLQLMWDEWSYSASVSTFCDPMPEVLCKPDGACCLLGILLLLPMVVWEGFHLPRSLKIDVEVNLCDDGMCLQRLPVVELSSLSLSLSPLAFLRPSTK